MKSREMQKTLLLLFVFHVCLVDNDSYSTWESLTAPVLKLGEVFGLGLTGLTHFMAERYNSLSSKYLELTLESFLFRSVMPQREEWDVF